MRITYLSEAVADQKDAVSWYRKESPPQIPRFHQERLALLQRIRTAPQHFPFVTEKHQAALMKIFPYRIVFIHQPDRIVIIAVSHTSRNPNHWRGREI